MSFDELGRPLRDITFCVVDLETTGGSAQAGSMITEIGAVKVRGGEVLGEFQTLVNPHTSIPPFIAVLTGITNSMVASSPPIESALPAFLEFAQGCVLVAHNAPFDVGFLKHFAEQQGRPWPGFEVLDTARLARRVVTRDDAPNCKLSSLAVAFGSAHHSQPPGAVRRPRHGRRAARPDGAARRPGRAHARGAADLQLAGEPRRPPQAAPRRAPAALPRRLPVPRRAGASALRRHRRDLRTRVRSYFTASETRSRMGEMVEPRGHGHRHRVRHPARGARARAAPDRRAQAALQPAQPPPREDALAQADRRALATALPGPRRSPRTAPTTSGPFASRRTAEKCLAALHETFPIRQCSDRLPITPHSSPCVLAEMGRCALTVRRQRLGRRLRRRWSPRSATTLLRQADEVVEALTARMDRLGRRRALRGGRRPPRPALGVRAGRVAHAAPRVTLVLCRAGRRPTRGRPPLGGPRRPPRTAGRRRE